MRSFVDKVAILDCIGFSLDPGRQMQVRFAKCLVHEDGRIERQYDDNKLICHRVTLDRKDRDRIDEIMETERRAIELMGYDPPTYEMIERIKAHAAIEWAASPTPALPAPDPMEFVPFDIAEKVRVN